jgi:general secretion pathway protein A
MYQRFYGLRDLPFELTPNPAYLYFTARHREALSNLEYGLISAKSLTLLVGEAGTGKTTLLKAALESDRCRGVRCVYLNNPALTREEFIATLAESFGLRSEARTSKWILLRELERVVRERRDSGEINALVVDEAQSLSVELLEEVRLLGNVETATEKLLPLVIAGQPSLAERLDDPALRQLKQRVALRCELAPFDLAETAAYVGSRIRTAGGVPSRLFTRDAITVIYDYSQGIPRTISVICDNALVSGMALGRQPVDRAIVVGVCRDFHLRPGESSAPGAESRTATEGGAAASALADTGHGPSDVKGLDLKAAAPAASPDGHDSSYSVATGRAAGRFRLFGGAQG